MTDQFLAGMQLTVPAGKPNRKGKEKEQSQQQDLDEGKSYENFAFFHVIGGQGGNGTQGRPDQWMTQSLFGTG